MKWTYAFGFGKAEGDGGMTAELGGKGAQLAEMSRMGLPVPPGFTIPVPACTHYFRHEGVFPDGLKAAVEAALARLGQMRGAGLGDAVHPLLVSVRSGALTSMPGMMDTVLNLGLNPQTVEALARQSGDERFAYDCYRRFLANYASVVLRLDPGVFEDLAEARRQDQGLEQEDALGSDDLRALCHSFREEIASQSGAPFPDGTLDQLWSAIRAVFDSWLSPRAISYRALNGISETEGTAVTVQAMVFGNRGAGSAAGVAFSRDPASGERHLYGEFLPDAQGEDIVSGVRTPQPLSAAMRNKQGGRKPSMEEAMPAGFAALAQACEILERHYRDLQDVEFTVERGELFLLQTRCGKRTAQAALRIAAEMAEEGLIDRATAIGRLDAAALVPLLNPVIDQHIPQQEFLRGLGASAGAATGEVAFSTGEVAALAQSGRDAVLVRGETSTDDIQGMYAARGILTARGGMTSHAAVVARGLGRPCVTGAGMLRIDADKGEMTAGGVTVRRGDIITLDGASGRVFLGAVPMRQPELGPYFARLLGWAGEIAATRVWGEAGTLDQALLARQLGADGIFLQPAPGADLAAIFRGLNDCPVALRLTGTEAKKFLAAAPVANPLIIIPYKDYMQGMVWPKTARWGIQMAPGDDVGAFLQSDARLSVTVIMVDASSADVEFLNRLQATLVYYCNSEISLCAAGASMLTTLRACADSGWNYVACAALHVPIARIVTAQAALKPALKKP